MHNKKFALFAAMGLAAGPALADHLSGGFGLDSAAPLWTESPTTLNAGQTSFGVRSEYQKLRRLNDYKLQQLRLQDANAHPEFYDHDAGGDAHARQADLHSVQSVLGASFRFAYGLTDDITLGLRLPFVYRSNIREMADAHDHGHGFVAHDIFDHGDSQGIGDMSFWGQYRFFKDEAQEAALLVGVKAPTGEVNNKGFRQKYNLETGALRASSAPGEGHSERLETHLQPGSGSWDGMFGVAYGYNLDIVKFNTSALYTVASKGAQDTDLGDTFNYNFAATVPTKLATPCDSCSWNLVMEVNGEWRDKEKRGDIRIGNSGGHTVYVSPGVRFLSGHNWSVGTSFGYAVITDQNGHQSEPDYRAMGTFNFAL